MKTKANNTICNFIFSKEYFVETMEEIKKQVRHDKNCHEAFKVILPDDYVTYYKNDFVVNQLLKIVKEAFNDNNSYSWIDYFIWDLDFGDKYKEGMVKVSSKNFQLKSISDLWDLLHLDIR